MAKLADISPRQNKRLSRNIVLQFDLPINYFTGRGVQQRVMATYLLCKCIEVIISQISAQSMMALVTIGFEIGAVDV